MSPDLEALLAGSGQVRRLARNLVADATLADDLSQDAWVAAQCYQDAEWPALVDLWRAYNLHLARVMAATPEAVRLRETRRHNFHQIAWQTVPEGEPATLDYFMRDYVDHLRHHLQQIFPNRSPATQDS